MGRESVSPLLLSTAALVGALGVVALVVFGWPGKNVVTLLVVGLMIGFMCSAGTSF